MHIKKEIREVITAELDAKELHIFRELLNYAYHRLDKHVGSGLQGRVSLEDINLLRQEICKVKK